MWTNKGNTWVAVCSFKESTLSTCHVFNKFCKNKHSNSFNSFKIFSKSNEVLLPPQICKSSLIWGSGRNRKDLIPKVWYTIDMKTTSFFGCRSIFRRLIVPKSYYSDRFLFRRVIFLKSFILESCYSKKESQRVFISKFGIITLQNNDPLGWNSSE